MACPLSESWFYAPGNVHKIVNVTGGELSLLDFHIQPALCPIISPAMKNQIQRHKDAPGDS
jgi:hypothetical protein